MKFGNERITEKEFWKICFVILLIMSVMMIFSQYGNKKVYNNFINTDYNGIIQNVRYCEKKKPFIKVNFKEYYISQPLKCSDNIYFDEFVKIKDSVIKKSGEDFIVLFRKNDSELWEKKVFKYENW